jgi:ring-1,2-phenylacetyl-CoA epoxidase subunit PaaD
MVIATQMTDTETRIWNLLEGVMDPEVPVLSVIDLGIIREVRETSSAGSTPTLEIRITPTYSGCPAMDMIQADIRRILARNGYPDLHLETVLSPAWTTDWMSEQAKDKLQAFGIAPPTTRQQVCHHMAFHEAEAISCPRCRSYHTSLISQFGSTACKALYRCEDCGEPFDYFKCH